MILTKLAQTLRQAPAKHSTYTITYTTPYVTNYSSRLIIGIIIIHIIIGLAQIPNECVHTYIPPLYPTSPPAKLATSYRMYVHVRFLTTQIRHHAAIPSIGSIPVHHGRHDNRWSDWLMMNSSSLDHNQTDPMLINRMWMVAISSYSTHTYTFRY